ncbi:hypothetical protein PSPO01_05925 [Paraphaeosphaeria sporulosa]
MHFGSLAPSPLALTPHAAPLVAPPTVSRTRHRGPHLSCKPGAAARFLTTPPTRARCLSPHDEPAGVDSAAALKPPLAPGPARRARRRAAMGCPRPTLPQVARQAFYYGFLNNC